MVVICPVQSSSLLTTVVLIPQQPGKLMYPSSVDQVIGCLKLPEKSLKQGGYQPIVDEVPLLMDELIA